MEASRFGFNLPPAYKFDPTDADIVAHYLLPRAAGLKSFPFSHALLDDDTCSCPPWELLRRHGHGGSDHAFFVGHPGDPAVNGGRASRGVRNAAGEVVGYWRGQKGEAVDLVVTRGGGEMRLRYRRYNLTYYSHGDSITSGWVMHEYHILEPKLLPGAVLSRVKITGRGKKELKKQRKVSAAADDGEGTSSDGGYVVGETTGGYDYTGFLDGGDYCFNPDQSGPSTSGYHVHDDLTGNAIAVNDGGGGTNGVQSDLVHVGGEAGDVINGGGATGEMISINNYTDFYNYDYFYGQS